jgi:hypothetical protein
MPREPITGSRIELQSTGIQSSVGSIAVAPLAWP